MMFSLPTEAAGPADAARRRRQAWQAPEGAASASTAAQQRGQCPDDQTMHAVAEFEVLRRRRGPDGRARPRRHIGGRTHRRRGPPI